jgi:hypothetical protein
MVRVWQTSDVSYWQNLPFETSPGNGTNVPLSPIGRAAAGDQSQPLLPNPVNVRFRR